MEKCWGGREREKEKNTHTKGMMLPVANFVNNFVNDTRLKKGATVQASKKESAENGGSGELRRINEQSLATTTANANRTNRHPFLAVILV